MKNDRTNLDEMYLNLYRAIFGPDATIKPITEEELQLRREQEQEELNQKVMASVAAATEESGIEELELSIRSFNCLLRAGIKTVKELINTPDDEICKVRNLGQRNSEEVIRLKKAFLSK